MWYNNFVRLKDRLVSAKNVGLADCVERRLPPAIHATGIHVSEAKSRHFTKRNNFFPKAYSAATGDNVATRLRCTQEFQDAFPWSRGSKRSWRRPRGRFTSVLSFGRKFQHNVTINLLVATNLAFLRKVQTNFSRNFFVGWILREKSNDVNYHNYKNLLFNQFLTGIIKLLKCSFLQV